MCNLIYIPNVLSLGLTWPNTADDQLLIVFKSEYICNLIYIPNVLSLGVYLAKEYILSIFKTVLITWLLLGQTLGAWNVGIQTRTQYHIKIRLQL